MSVSGPTRILGALLEACRPKQWIKNGFVLAPLIFSGHLGDWGSLWKGCLAFLLFCAYSSSVYLLNDIADIERDRLHPKKRNRPIASGRLSVHIAGLSSAIMVVAALLISLFLDFRFSMVGLGYLILNIAYSWRLKTIVILDGLSIATGFVLRAYGGAAAIGESNSDWLYLCTVLLSLFLAFSKRRHEASLLEDNAASHRRILADYPLPFLDQIIAAVTGATIVCYSLYTLDADTIAHFGNDNLRFTIPFVLYGILRYLFLVYRCEEGGNPTELVLTDRPLRFAIIGWLIVAGIAIYG